jgi:hypothetical protein
VSDWEQIKLLNYDGSIKDCVRFNGGQTNIHNKSNIRNTTKFGYSHGLYVYLYIHPNDFINYYIGDTNARPVAGEIYRFLDGGLTSNLIVNKFVEKKLGKPFNPCHSELSKETDHESPLFKKIVRGNYTYRQINCYDLCYFMELSEICDCSFTGINYLRCKFDKCDNIFIFMFLRYLRGTWKSELQSESQRLYTR